MKSGRTGMFTMTGKFEGVSVYESRWMPRRAGMALPGIGIVVYTGANSTRKNITLLRHEFGHFLQAQEIGIIPFYFRIGLPSLFSAMRNGKHGHSHHEYWTEVWANQLAGEYFKNGPKKV